MKLKKFISKSDLLIENTLEMYIFFDNTGRIIECNIKALNELGYGEDIYHVTVDQIFKEIFDFNQDEMLINTKSLDKTCETVAYRKNQTCFPVILRVAIKRDKKSFLGLCTAMNIQEKKETLRELGHAQQELKAFQQNRNDMVANITHELRTPVNGIMGLSNSLLEMDSKEKQKETVNLIRDCCKNLNRIINDLLDYSQIINNKLRIRKKEFEFRKFIHDVIAINQCKIDEKGLKLLVSVSSDIPDRLVGDELRLAQVLNNLFSNAIKFTSEGQIALEVVKLAQSEHDVELFFMVIDTGIGISAEDKDRMFQSFIQGDGSISRKFGGTGLGLSLCKSLVEAMHGTMSVDSEKNKGSTFSFSVHLELPIHSRNIIMRGKPIPIQNKTDDQMDMKDISTSKIVTEKEPSQYIDNRAIESTEEYVKNLDDTMDKISICLELGSWDKAEKLAYFIKGQIPTEMEVLKKSVFRLLLAIRKESYAEVKMILTDIKAAMNGVMK